MTLQVTPRYILETELCASVFITGSPRQVGWGKTGFCGHSKRAPFKQLVVGSSRNPGHPRAPISRGRILSNESLRAVQELKRAHARGDDAKLSTVLKTRVARLLKFDLLAVLMELRRQNECDLALMVFDIVHKEFWYKPDEELFSELVATMARNNRIEDVEKLYALATSEGVQPGVGFFTDMVCAQIGVGNLPKAVELYGELREAGHDANPAYGILRRALEANGELELAARLVQEYKDSQRNNVETEEEEDEANMQHVVYS